MKPDWKDAPEWARFVARDRDGTWVWFEQDPEPDCGKWYAEGKVLEIALPDYWGTKEPRP